MGRKSLEARINHRIFAFDYFSSQQIMTDNEYIDKLGKREERIRAQDTAALIEEFKDKHSGNVALIRQELQDRYKSGRDRDAITLAFSNSIVSDQQWVKNQEKKQIK